MHSASSGGPDSRLWHPFSDMAAVRGNELVITRGDDVWVWDEQGRRYLDAFASLWYVNVGHGRREIIDAIGEQLRELEAFTVFFDYANRPALDLADRLAALSPMPDCRVFLTSGGSDAIDTAVKLARRYWFEHGSPERTHVITREQSYHGMNGIGTSVAGIPANREGWGPAPPDSSRVAHDSAEALEAEILRVGPERVAAFLCEPVIGAGGVHPPAPGYLEEVAALCRRHGVLFVCDAVICGFGRLGTWFGIEHWDVELDMIVFAKGVTSGYLPLGGVLVGPRVAEPFWSSPGTTVRHGHTYAGHPACCAAALANIDVLEREGLLQRGRELEGLLHRALAPYAAHPAVAVVRSGVGALAAIELHGRSEEPAPTLDAPAIRVMHEAREAGVIVRATDAHTIAVCPPLTTTEEHVDVLTAALDRGLAALDPVATGAGA